MKTELINKLTRQLPLNTFLRVIVFTAWRSLISGTSISFLPILLTWPTMFPATGGAAPTMTTTAGSNRPLCGNLSRSPARSFCGRILRLAPRSPVPFRLSFCGIPGHRPSCFLEALFIFKSFSFLSPRAGISPRKRFSSQAGSSTLPRVVCAPRPDSGPPDVQLLYPLRGYEGPGGSCASAPNSITKSASLRPFPAIRKTRRPATITSSAWWIVCKSCGPRTSLRIPSCWVLPGKSQRRSRKWRPPVSMTQRCSVYG
jgi:hypothetical protein